MIAGFHGFLNHGHLRSRTCSRTRIWSAASETKIAMSESHWGTPGNVYQLIIKKYVFNLWRKGSFSFVSPMFLWHDQHVYIYWPWNTQAGIIQIAARTDPDLSYSRTEWQKTTALNHETTRACASISTRTWQDSVRIWRKCLVEASHTHCEWRSVFQERCKHRYYQTLNHSWEYIYIYIYTIVYLYIYICICRYIIIFIYIYILWKDV